MTYTAEQLAAMSDDELRRVIAGVLGWSEIEEYEHWFEDYDIDGWTTTLRGTKEGRNGIQLPDWPTDANPALRLLEEYQGELYYSRPYGVWCVKLYIPPGEEMAVKQHESAPRAICEAWILWRQVQP
jgi:hypothetical protein